MSVIVHINSPKENGETDQPELTTEELKRIERAQKSTRAHWTGEQKTAVKHILISAIILLILGLCVFGAAFILDHYANIGWIFTLVLGLGILLAALNFLLIIIVLNPLPGFKQVIRFYYALIIFLNIGLLIVAVLSFIVPNEIANFAQESLKLDVNDMADLEDVLSSTYDSVFLIIIILGILLLVIVGIMAFMAHQINILVSWKRANEIIMLVCDVIIVLPGCIAILMGFYIYDSALTTDAPTTGFILFVIGILIVFVMFLNLLGKALYSKVFYYIAFGITAVAGVILFIFGIVIAIIQSTAVKFCVDNWKTLRLVLTPTFNGKYDITYWENFLNSYMKLAAALIVIYGLLLIIFSKANYDTAKNIDLYIYYRLFRSYDQDNDGKISAEELSNIMLSQKIEVDSEDLKDMFWNHNVSDKDEGANLAAFFDICQYKDHIYDLAEDYAENGFDPNERKENEPFQESVLRTYLAFYNFQSHLYKKLVESSKTMTAKCLKVLIVIIFILFILVIVCFGVFFLYPAVCEDSLGTKRFTGLDYIQAKRITLNTYVDLGSINVLSDDTLIGEGWLPQIKLRSSSVVDPNTLLTVKNDEYTVKPSSSKILGVDFECQSYTLNLVAHPERSFIDTKLELHSFASFSGITYDTKNPLNVLDATSTNGGISITNFDINNLHVETQSGDVSLTNGKMKCAGTNETGLELKGDKNSITINNLKVTDCQGVKVTGSAGGYEFSNIIGESSSTYNPILDITTDRGGIYLTNISFPKIRINYLSGSISMRNIETKEMKISTTDANVHIWNPIIETGSLIIETSTGDVFIHLSPGSFRGVYNIQTRNAVEQRYFNTTDLVHPQNKGLKDETGAISGDIGCRTYSACTYLGSIIVMSNTGLVTLEDDSQWCVDHGCT